MSGIAESGSTAEGEVPVALWVELTAAGVVERAVKWIWDFSNHLNASGTWRRPDFCCQVAKAPEEGIVQ